MLCKVGECNRDVMYITQQVCQKHYFRFMRNGSYDLKGWRDDSGVIYTRKYRAQNAAGYQMLDEPGHPLAMKNGYTYEHRLIVYKKYGEVLPDCECCGKSLNWKNVHIDHIDDDVTNNEPLNLRPLCNWCNVSQGRGPEHERLGNQSVTYNSRTMTPMEWAREPEVIATGHTIRNRLKNGLSVEDAFFMPNKTHKAK